MSVNKYRPHIFVLPEDDTNLQLANGFHLQVAWTRQRQMQVRYAASHVQHIHKALEQMNVKLTEVASDIMGVTGTRIIEAILQGERDANFCLRFFRDENGKVDFDKIPRLYLIDFDQAISPLL